MKILPIVVSGLLALNAQAVFELTFTDNVPNVGESTVSGYTGEVPTGVVIPEDHNGLPVVAIGAQALQGTGVQVLVLPESLQTIEFAAFVNCTQLSIVDFSRCTALTNIGEHAFVNTGLTALYLPNVRTFGNHAFADCDSLQSVTVGNDGGDFETVLGASVFFYCQALTTVVLRSSVASIPDQAFNWCEALTSITFGNSVTNIGQWAFAGCYGLQTLPLSVSLQSLGAGAFGNCRALKYMTIPEAMTNVPTGLFIGCWALTNVTLSSATTNLSMEAFEDCRSLPSIQIPDTVVSIGPECFKGCFKLSDVQLPSELVSIGYSAFSLCTNLTSLVFPSKVAHIGYWGDSFQSCLNLSKVYFLGNCPTFYAAPFWSTQVRYFSVKKGTSGWPSSFYWWSTIPVIPTTLSIEERSLYREPPFPALEVVAIGRSMGGTNGTVVLGDAAIGEFDASAIGCTSGAKERGVAVGQYGFSSIHGVALGFDASSYTNKGIAIGAGSAVYNEDSVQLGVSLAGETDAMFGIGNVIDILDENWFLNYDLLQGFDNLVMSFPDYVDSKSNGVYSASFLQDSVHSIPLGTNAWLELDNNVLYHVSVVYSNSFEWKATVDSDVTQTTAGSSIFTNSTYWSSGFTSNVVFAASGQRVTSKTFPASFPDLIDGYPLAEGSMFSVEGLPSFTNSPSVGGDSINSFFGFVAFKTRDLSSNVVASVLFQKNLLFNSTPPYSDFWWGIPYSQNWVNYWWWDHSVGFYGGAQSSSFQLNVGGAYWNFNVSGNPTVTIFREGEEYWVTNRLAVMSFSNNVPVLLCSTGLVENVAVTGVSKVVIPSSPAGLTEGMLWNDAGVVKVIHFE